MEAKKQKTDGGDVRLPESVEAAINRISTAKQPPPLKNYARRMLLGIGEQASLEILSVILSTASPIRSFSGFVSKLVEKKYPTQAAAVLNQYKSPEASPLGMWSPSLASPNTACSTIPIHLTFFAFIVVWFGLILLLGLLFSLDSCKKIRWLRFWRF